MPSTFSDDTVIEVAQAVGGLYATLRTWLELEDVKQQAILEGFILRDKFKPELWNGEPRGWLGFHIKYRLHDWSRKQRYYYTGRSRSAYSVKKEKEYNLEILSEKNGSNEIIGSVTDNIPSTDLGYWFIEELSAYVPPRINGYQRLKREAANNKDLTQSELYNLILLSEGYSQPEIAKARGISSETVRSQVRKARLRLGAKTVTQAVAIGVRVGII
jgi:DNA-binding CsgD family transcriptional regulator